MCVFLLPVLVLLCEARFPPDVQPNGKRPNNELRGEPTYCGKTTMYWREIIKHCPKCPYRFSYDYFDIEPPLRNGDPAAIPVLVDLLASTDPGVRMYVVEALGELGQAAKSAVPILMPMVNDKACGGFGWLVSEKVVVSLAEIAPNATAVLQLLEKTLQDDHIKTRCAAAAMLMKIDPDGKGRVGMTTLFALLNSNEPQYRSDAVWAIGESGTAARRAIPQLTKALNDETEDVRMAAQSVLDKTNPPKRPSSLHGLINR
jgi:HEAT repeat protein